MEYAMQGVPSLKKEELEWLKKELEGYVEKVQIGG